MQLNNAGENKLLEQCSQSKDWKLELTSELTTRAAPQQNSLAEEAFATTVKRGRAMMAQANVLGLIRYKLHSKAFKTATLLNGLIPVEIDGETKTRYEHWGREWPCFVNYLCSSY